MNIGAFCFAAILSLLVGDRAAAMQEGKPPEEPSLSGNDDIVVTGRKYDDRSIVDDQTSPLALLDADRLKATGATSIGDLLRRLAPLLTAPGGKEPLILLNGRPMLSEKDLSTLPPEAIEKLQVLAEENAPRFGNAPDRRVVNIVLQRRFTSAEIEPRLSTTTDGAGTEMQANGLATKLADRTHLSFSANYRRQDGVTEYDREPGPAPSTLPRSLVAASNGLKLNGMAELPVSTSTTAIVSWEAEHSASRSLLGTGPATPDAGPPLQQTSTTTYRAGAMLGGTIDRWQWTAQGNVGRLSNDNALMGTVRQDNRSRSRTIDTDVRISGPALELPAGPLQVAGFVSYVNDRGVSSVRSADGVQRQTIGQASGDASLTLTIPLVAPRPGRPSAIGKLNATLTGGVARTSGSGSAPRLDASLQWAPTRIANLSIGMSIEQQPTSATARLLPPTRLPGIPVFDYATGDTALVTITTGGNPNLRAERRERRTANLSIRPWKKGNALVDIGYVDTSVRHPLMSLAAPSPLIAAAFPDRFTRDSGGRLIAIDTRAVNLQRSQRKEVSIGVSLYVEPQVPPEALAEQPGLQWSLNLRSTLAIEDRLTLRSGGPSLDLLAGDTIGNGAGQPRLQLLGQASVSRAGATLAIDGRMQGSRQVRGVEATTDLHFRSLAVIDANLTLPASRVMRAAWTEKAQIIAGVRNAFNERQSVRDRNGNTPLAFRPAYLDPFGRIVSLAVRSRF